MLLSAGVKQPPAMFDMGRAPDDAFDQQDFADGPADGRDRLRAQTIAAIVDRDMRIRRGAERERGLMFEQVADERGLKGAGLGQRIVCAQGDGFAVFNPVEGEREGRGVETVERSDNAGEPVGRRLVKVEQRDEGDVEKVRPAAGIVAGERGDLRLHIGRRLGHDVERVAGAHGRSVTWRGVGIIIWNPT